MYDMEGSRIIELHWMVLTIHGDAIFCADPPIVNALIMTCTGYQVTKSGWHGSTQVVLNIPMIAVRYFQPTNVELFGRVPDPLGPELYNLSEIERDEAVYKAVRTCGIILETCIHREDGQAILRQQWPKAFA